MREIKIQDIRQEEWYVVCVPSFSESGWEIAQCISGKLISQANGDDITLMVNQIYAIED